MRRRAKVPKNTGIFALFAYCILLAFHGILKKSLSFILIIVAVHLLDCVLEKVVVENVWDKENKKKQGKNTGTEVGRQDKHTEGDCLEKSKEQRHDEMDQSLVLRELNLHEDSGREFRIRSGLTQISKIRQVSGIAFSHDRPFRCSCTDSILQPGNSSVKIKRYAAHLLWLILFTLATAEYNRLRHSPICIFGG